MTDPTYKPHGKSKLTLDRAMGYIQAVPYRVTLRWLFYRLLQDGTYGSKQDYEQLKLSLIHISEPTRPY